MKVSFGMGMPAKVPWIAFLAPGMFKWWILSSLFILQRTR